MKHYTIYMRAEPEGGYTVIVPALPGCITWGKNLADARRMATDAIRAYLTSLKKHGELIPSDEEALVSAVDV